MRLSQDVLRREILYAPENTNHPTMDLLSVIVQFGWERGYQTVIIEGIFGAKKNGEQLKSLLADADESHTFYFDIPFEETVRRHYTKPNANDFGEIEMREWWKEKDYLGVDNEIVINGDISASQAVDLMYEMVMQKSTTNRT